MTGDDAVSEVCVELSGEYDLRRRQELALLFESLQGDDPVVIDLAKVSYLDSTMLNELSIFRSRNRERQITLRGANENIRRILRLVDFDSLFNVTEAES
ncbi:MAG: STAS domain-containing protein [Candidatus Cybelea sp.]